MMTQNRLSWMLFTGVLLLLASSVLAADFSRLVDDVRADFSIADGYILLPLDGEYLVDLGAQSGTRVGDLLSATRPGERIVHPVSGEDLGSVDERIALLEVTSVKPKYSHARVISGAEDVARGTAIERFAGLRAVFEGEGATADLLYSELREALPSLRWQGDESSREPAELRFVLNAGQLEVRSDTALLRRYALERLPDTKTIVADRGGQLAKTPYGVYGGKSGQTLVDYPAEKTRALLAATLPGEVLMADFVRGADGLLLAATDGSVVRVYRVASQLELLAERSFADRRVHSLSWWQPATGELLLAVSGSTEVSPGMGPSTRTDPLSNLLRLAEGRLDLAYQDVAYFFGTVDRDGDGLRETLLGQGLDLDNVYGRVVQLHADDGRLRTISPDYDLPYPFPVQGSRFARLSGRTPPETIRLKSGVLTIFRGKKKVFQSRKGFGGSLSQLRYDRNPEQEATLFGTAVFEVNPVEADIDGDGLSELVIVSSSRSGFLTRFGGRSAVEGAGLAVLKYRDGDYVRGTLHIESDVPIQGLYADSKRILFISSGIEDPAGAGKVSRLMIVPLDEKD